MSREIVKISIDPLLISRLNAGPRDQTRLENHLVSQEKT
jgi:hypothetical protein